VNLINRTLCVLCVVLGMPLSAMAQASPAGADGAYQWVPARLIPNEFGLPDGTWAQASVRECISKCSANKSCSGFSIEKKFGDAWRSGCQGGLCDQKTECHAKGPFGAGALWTPTDAQIRVPKVDAKSNAWIEQWGTVLKKQ
jgi:hypothetical protein